MPFPVFWSGFLCMEQVVIKMRSHDLRSLLTTSMLHVVHIDLLQVDCQNLLSTAFLQVVSTSCNKSANDKLQQA